MKRVRAAAAAAGIALMATAFAAPAQAAVDGAGESTTSRHCVAHAQSVGEVGADSKLTCFDSFSAAVADATDGAVVLPSSAREVTQAQMDEARLDTSGPQASTVIGIEYEYASGGGDSLIISVNGSCSAGGVWSYSSMPAGYNNWVSSAYTCAGCKSRHFQYVNFGGPSELCGCAGMGAMDNLTSSIRWSSSGY